MQDQTKSLAEQAWELYQNLSPIATSFKAAFIAAVESVYAAPKEDTSTKEERIKAYKPTFADCDEETKTAVYKMYAIMDKGMAEAVISNLAELPYAIAAGILDMKDIPPDSISLQRLVFGAMANKKLESILSGILKN